MKIRFLMVITLSVALACVWAAVPVVIGQENYLGFDRNDYPGDANLAGLRKTFHYTSYWLNDPPGAAVNSWQGKRGLLKQQGFGFLVLFNGRVDAQLKGKDAAAVGKADGEAAVTAARKEGFSSRVLIFLDQEEGGRLLPEQAAYVFGWIAAVRAGGDRAGVYCSGIEVPDGKSTISTARDLRAHPEGGKLPLWVANDACPPSNGCARTSQGPDESGVKDALVWQYAQSPRRPQFSTGCLKNAALDGMCYAPGMPQNPSTFLDMNTARSSDPSEDLR